MNPILLKYSIGSYVFLVVSFKYLKGNILPFDTGAPQWRNLRRKESCFRFKICITKCCDWKCYHSRWRKPRINEN